MLGSISTINFTGPRRDRRIDGENSFYNDLKRAGIDIPKHDAMGIMQGAIKKQIKNGTSTLVQGPHNTNTERVHVISIKDPNTGKEIKGTTRYNTRTGTLESFRPI